MLNKLVGERLKNLRREHNWTRAEAGNLLGISEQQLGRIERGSRHITVETLDKVCELTGASADYILRGIVDPVHKVAAVNGLSNEQVQVTLDIAMNVIRFINTKNGNNALLKEAFRQSQPA